MPQIPAEVIRVSHAVLVQRACDGRECKVMGWFPPGERIYIDERLRPNESLLAASIVIHEMVHHLQYRAGRFDALSCSKSIGLEREAYAVQREFLLRYGVYQPVGASEHRVGCVTSSAAAHPPADAETFQARGEESLDSLPRSDH